MSTTCKRNSVAFKVGKGEATLEMDSNKNFTFSVSHVNGNWDEITDGYTNDIDEIKFFLQQCLHLIENNE